MGVKANWFADDLSAESDPFSAMNMSISPVVSIESSEDELYARLQELLKREARLDAVGITCPLKDMPDASCLACPVCKLGDPNSRLSALCRVGQEQERVMTMVAAKQVGV
jgi:hypothetical protein